MARSMAVLLRGLDKPGELGDEKFMAGEETNKKAGGRASARRTGPHVAVVLPCYRTAGTVASVVAAIGPEVRTIIAVDDACPDGTGDALAAIEDDRLTVLRHAKNAGVGAAMVTGYREALARRADIVVKMDSDGQMDAAMLARLVKPIVEGRADYTKGNRFFHPEDVTAMPAVRLLGNAVLSLFAKVSSGYWPVVDPNNGYTAIEARVLSNLPLDRIAKRYFFESDMLFRLGALRAVVQDVPMPAIYAGEKSSLSVAGAIMPFYVGHLRNALKRIAYAYFLRDFNVASLELLLGVPAFLIGTIIGAVFWLQSSLSGVPATAGMVMLAGLPVIVGVFLILSFINYDVQNVPRNPIHPVLDRRDEGG